MKVHTPTSNERMGRSIRIVDLFSVLLAGPIAMALRDPSLFSGTRFGPATLYCLIGYGAGLLMVIVFHLGRGLHDHISAREVRSVVVASLVATGLTAAGAFSVDRLNYIPRSLPIIQFFALCALMLGGRVLAMASHGFAAPCVNNYLMGSHNLLICANAFASSYLKMLDAFNVDRTNIVAILDRNSKLFGRALLGHPIIGPPSALARVVKEYKVHGVQIDGVLICDNRPSEEDKTWRDVEENCGVLGVELKFLSDVLGFELGETIKKRDDDRVIVAGSKPYAFAKRMFDVSMSLAAAIIISPFVALVALGILIDLGWPLIFWQKRLGYRGESLLIYKFRTLHAPYDRHGNFVEEDRRPSRYGSLLRRARFDELPQLWNVFSGDMSFVGPRPLLPIDQPDKNELRLSVRPGVTGWAQVNGGRQISADEKGSLDDWYVRHASFWLDVRILIRTVGIVCLGDEWRLRRPAETVEGGKQGSGRWRWPRLLAPRATDPQEGAALD
jgi:lipopolysaccharide/colanic/teichoic acid biosynthesis glycosyltransferase